MASANIASLPFELLSLIINHVSPDTPSLANLALVSHSLNTVTTPILYRQFRQHETWQKKHPIYHFTHTILARPDLANQVRHLSLGRLYPIERRKLRIHDDFLALCRETINKTFAAWLGMVLCGEQRQAWLDHFDDILPGTLQSVLLCALRNLETLFLEDDQEMVYVWQLFDAASRLTPGKRLIGKSIHQEIPFSKLYSIRRIGDRRIARECLHDYLGYFKLPSICKLEFSNIYASWRESDESSNEWSLCQRSSPVQYLSLQHSHLSTYALTSVIGICANLKEFHYTTSCRGPRIMCLEPHDILESLLIHEKTLETLRLNLEPFRWLLHSPPQPFGSALLKLTRLKHLVLNYWTIFVPDSKEDYIFMIENDTSDPATNSSLLPTIIPPSLETLELTHCDSALYPHLQALDSAKRAARLPNLRRVKCLFRTISSYGEDLDLSSFEFEFGFSELHCNLYNDCEGKSDDQVDDCEGGNPMKDYSDIFQDEVMVARYVKMPESNWI